MSVTFEQARELLSSQLEAGFVPNEYGFGDENTFLIGWDECIDPLEMVLGEPYSAFIDRKTGQITLGPGGPNDASVGKVDSLMQMHRFGSFPQDWDDNEEEDEE